MFCFDLEFFIHTVLEVSQSNSMQHKVKLPVNPLLILC